MRAGLVTVAALGKYRHGSEVRTLRWTSDLLRLLRALHKSKADADAAAKSAPWKLAVASWLKTHTQARNA